MQNDSTQFDPIAEIDRYFDDTSLAGIESPGAVIIAGGVATGKTTLRRTEYSTGYVLLDAAEIFLVYAKASTWTSPALSKNQWI